MKPSILVAAAALVALGAAAQPANARIAAGLNLSTHTLRGDAFTRLDHADGMRHMRKFNDDPPDDPAPKPPKTPTGTTGSGSGSDGGGDNPGGHYGGPYHPNGGFWDRYGHWHRYP